MKFRHECKHVISHGDMLVLRQRLGAVMKPDVHAENGRYRVRSLYFDNAEDKALMEKADGVNPREKFRIRYYNGDTGRIHLEKKSRINGLSAKESADISAEEARCIIEGDREWMLNSGRPLIRELYLKMKTQGLEPKTVVDYIREPFVFAPGNVRVTLDYDIQTGICSTDFLNAECVTVRAGDPPVILEVKWDDFLPDIIGDIVQINRRAGAFSKYAACRIYG